LLYDIEQFDVATNIWTGIKLNKKLPKLHQCLAFPKSETEIILLGGGQEKIFLFKKKSETEFEFDTLDNPVNKSEKINFPHPCAPVEKNGKVYLFSFQEKNLLDQKEPEPVDLWIYSIKDGLWKKYRNFHINSQPKK